MGECGPAGGQGLVETCSPSLSTPRLTPSPSSSRIAQVVPGDVSVPRYPPVPAPRHWNLFNDIELPKPLASFDEPDASDKPSWVRSLPR